MMTTTASHRVSIARPREVVKKKVQHIPCSSACLCPVPRPNPHGEIPRYAARTDRRLSQFFHFPCPSLKCHLCTLLVCSYLLMLQQWGPNIDIDSRHWRAQCRSSCDGRHVPNGIGSVQIACGQSPYMFRRPTAEPPLAQPCLLLVFRQSSSSPPLGSIFVRLFALIIVYVHCAQQPSSASPHTLHVQVSRRSTHNAVVRQTHSRVC